MNHDRLHVLWPVLLEVERAAASSLARSKRREVQHVYPVRGVVKFRALNTDRDWTSGDIARLGNIWNRVMADTGSGGILNSTEG